MTYMTVLNNGVKPNQLVHKNTKEKIENILKVYEKILWCYQELIRVYKY